MAAEHAPIRKSVVPPQHYPNWKAHSGPRVVEYVSDTDSRRKKRNDRRKTLFQKSHELAVISGGHVFTMYIDDNGQTWIYTNSQALWDSYCTIGLKQGPLEKRCDENIKVIDVSDASLEETKFYGTAAHLSEPTENFERILYPVEIKTEPMFSPDDVAVEVGSMPEFSEESSSEPMQQHIGFPGSSFDTLLPQPTMMVKSDNYKQEEQPPLEVEHAIVGRVPKEGPSLKPTPSEPSEPQAGQKRQIEPPAKYRIAGSSCAACERGFPDKKRLRLHLTCHKDVGQGSRRQLPSSLKVDRGDVHEKKPP